jgi:hypothetical protein
VPAGTASSGAGSSGGRAGTGTHYVAQRWGFLAGRPGPVAVVGRVPHL